jgi:hypothetical protein
VAERRGTGEVLVRPSGPGRVELTDAYGDTWEFEVSGVDPRALACTIVKDEMVDGILQVLIDTEVPSVDGVRRFRVLRAMVP